MYLKDFLKFYLLLKFSNEPVEKHKEKLLEFLENYLTEHKRQLFEEVLFFRTNHFTVALEDLYQDHNTGAIARTCDCFGIQEMYVIENHYRDKITNRIAKGAQKWVDVNVFDKEDQKNTQHCIDKLRAKGYKLIATTPHQSDCLLPNFDIHDKSAFFFGAEKKGLSDTVLEQADGFLKIPILGFTESFNVSVSAAIILNELTQRLHKSKDIDWHMTEEEILDKKIEWTLKTVKGGKKLVKYFKERISKLGK